MRVLYIQRGVVPPPRDLRLDKMSYVPAPVSGDVLLPTWARNADEILQTVGEKSYPEHAANNFTYHLYLAGPKQGVLQRFRIFLFYLRMGLRLNRKGQYDCIVTYGWGLTGAAALLLSRLIKAKLIVEVGGAPHSIYEFGGYTSTKKTLGLRLMKAGSNFFLHLVVGRADRVQLRYPNQLEHFPKLHDVPASIIHGFVPVSVVPFTGQSDGSILLVGAPWYLKGVDTLIRAFHEIEEEFPNVSLRVVGHYPDQRQLREMIGDNPRIEIMKARPNREVLALIANCSVFVLASRTEAGARVFIEAMAAGKPIIASRVDGNPYYIREGVNGMLFEKENYQQLAEKLRVMLGSSELRQQLGKTGYELAKTKYDEQAFGREFARMVELTVAGHERMPVTS
jgi:glycosyltransferase involved in cell wall biosynthesis